MKYTLSVLVENHAGVLSKISGLFSRRGFNIDSLAVGVTSDPKYSRITIVASGDEYIIEQLEKQLNKVIPVIKVKTFEQGSFISRELLLVKVSASPNKRNEIINIAQITNAKIIDVSTSTISIEIAEESDKIEMFLNLLKPYGIKEVVRTGTIAIEKGENHQ